jgi:hypothetical protein
MIPGQTKMVKSVLMVYHQTITRDLCVLYAIVFDPGFE